MVTSGTDRKPFCINNKVFGVGPYNLAGQGRILIQWGGDGSFIKADTLIGDKMQDGMPIVNENGYLFTSVTAIGPVQFGNNFLVTCPSSQSSAVFALRHDPSILEPYPEDSTGVSSYHGLNNPVKLYPNPVANTLFIENEDAPIEHIVVLDMTGKEIFHQDFFDNRGEINVSSLPNGMYMVKALCNGSFQISKFVKSNFNP